MPLSYAEICDIGMLVSSDHSADRGSDAMTKKKKILLISSATVLALLIFIIAILPIIVKNKAIAAIADETGAQGPHRKNHHQPLHPNRYGQGACH